LGPIRRQGGWYRTAPVDGRSRHRGTAGLVARQPVVAYLSNANGSGVSGSSGPTEASDTCCLTSTAASLAPRRRSSHMASGIGLTSKSLGPGEEQTRFVLSIWHVHGYAARSNASDRLQAGLSNWDRVTPATILLAETVEAAPDAQVLQLGCGHGALGAALARQVPGGHVALMDTDFIALTMAKQTLAANGAANAQVQPAISVLPDGAGAFDTVAMELPRTQARPALAGRGAGRPEARRSAVPGRANEQGIQPPSRTRRPCLESSRAALQKGKSGGARRQSHTGRRPAGMGQGGGHCARHVARV